MAATASSVARKSVTSSVPGHTPRDLSQDLARHRDKMDAGPTQPPGGWPQTTGRDPDAPQGVEPSNAWSGDPLSSATPQAFSSANSFHPSGNY
jgi:hypothetical protein